jgi:hypothetical protein
MGPGRISNDLVTASAPEAGSVSTMTAVEIGQDGPVALPMPTAWRISPCCVGTRIGAERT